jgi:hypothetical protein
MIRTSVAMRVASLVVAGGALMTTPAPNAAPTAGERRAAQQCSHERTFGEAVKWFGTLSVQGTAVETKALRPGDVIETNEQGRGQICLTRDLWRCTIYRQTKVRVLAVKTTKLLLQMQRGRLRCSGQRYGQRQPELNEANTALTIKGTIVPEPWTT